MGEQWVKNMEKKVKVALFDKDLKVEVKKYPLTSDGSRIDITQGGKGHFKPAIASTTHLDIPRPKIRGGGHERVYFVMKWAKKCVDFKTGEVEGPDPDQVMQAARAQILKSKAEEAQSVHWSVWLTIGMLVLIFLKVFGVLV